MKRVSATDIGLEGFRLTREKPKAVLSWTGLFLLSSLVAGAVLITVAGDAMNALTRAQPNADPAQMLAQLAPLGRAYLLLIPLSLILYGVIYAAVHRAVLRPSDGSGGFPRLGADELRQAVVLLLYGLVLLGVYVAAALVVIVLGAVLGAAVPALGAVVGVLGTLAAVACVLWVGVRFSLASPLTLMNRRIEFARSWSLTRGHFWPLLGGYLLAVIFALLVFISGLIIYSAFAFILGGGASALGQAFAPDFSSLGAYFTLPMIIYLLVASVFSALGAALMIGASSEAVRQLAGSTDEMAATFA